MNFYFKLLVSWRDEYGTRTSMDTSQKGNRNYGPDRRVHAFKPGEYYVVTHGCPAPDS